VILVKEIPAREFASNDSHIATFPSHRSGGTLFDALDKMKQDVNESDDQNNKFYSAIKSTGIILTAGFASWVLRGSSLLASFLSTMPFWRSLDPLPILAGARNNTKKAANINDPKKDTSEDVDDVDTIFTGKSQKPDYHKSADADEGYNRD
jgi:hypothetical protein